MWRKKIPMAYRWKPLEPASIDPADYTHPKYRIITEQAMQEYGCSFEEAAAKLKAYDKECRYFRNDLYQVQLRPFFNEAWQCHMVHINIRRIDGAPIFDWRHRQRIKNELIGEENEAFEIYPAESRLTDEANKYHLWAFVNPSVRIPVEAGRGRRTVQLNEVRSPPGVRQRAYSAAERAVAYTEAIAREDRNEP
jgi:hypothetical protein